MGKYQYHGVTLKEQPQKYSYGIDGRTCTRTYHGYWPTVVASASYWGSNINTWFPDLAGYYINSVEAVEETGGTGTVTITLSTTMAQGAIDDPANPVYEVEWTRVDKNIKEHPIWSTSGSAYYITATEWDTIAKWEDSRTISTGSLGAGGLELIDRLRNSQDSYMVYIPTVKATTKHSSRPTTGGCGQVQNPPASTYPTTSGNGKTYIYIKTADRVVKSDFVFERTQEWVGFEKVDTLIIGNT